MTKNFAPNLSPSIAQRKGAACGVMSNLFLIFLGLFALPFSAQAADPSSTCTQLFRQNQHKLAADCYAQLASQMPKGSGLDALQKKQKGLYLQNAAKAYSTHASEQKDSQTQRFFYELAAKQLRTYLEEKLCLKVYRCQAVKGMLYDAETKVGYATLTLTNSLPEAARVEIKGFQLDRDFSLTDQTNVRLRAGTFKIRVTYPKKESKELSIELKENETRVFETATMGKGPYQQGLTSGQIGGISLVATGIAILGIAAALIWVSKNIERDNIAQLNKERYTTPTSAIAFSEAYEDARRFNALGFIGLGVGSAALGGGLLWFFLAKPQKKKVAQVPSQRNKRLALPHPPPPTSPCPLQPWPVTSVRPTPHPIAQTKALNASSIRDQTHFHRLREVGCVASFFPWAR